MKRIAFAAAAFFVLFGTANAASSDSNELPQCRGIYTAAENSVAPQAMSISIHNVGPAFIRKTEGAEMRFEISRRSGSVLSYVAVFDERTPLLLDGRGSAVVAEIELMTSRRNLSDMTLDPALTILGNRAGTQKATTANGRLQIQ
jgi:hypothetical protein